MTQRNRLPDPADPSARLLLVVGDSAPPGAPRRAVATAGSATGPTSVVAEWGDHRPEEDWEGEQEPGDWPADELSDDDAHGRGESGPLAGACAHCSVGWSGSGPGAGSRAHRVTGAADAATRHESAVDENPAEPRRPPDSAAGRLFRLGRDHVGLLGVMIVVVLVVTGTRLISARGHEVAVAAEPSPISSPASSSDTSEQSAGEAASSPAPSSSPLMIRVHVMGAVNAPGVVEVPGGARVADALNAAGGLTVEADPAELNLASEVPDGAQILVGTLDDPKGELRTGSVVVAEGVGDAGQAGAGINLNTATQAELETLHGIGPVTAAKIIAWREEHGGFNRIEELQEVSGIGPATYREVAAHVHV